MNSVSKLAGAGTSLDVQPVFAAVANAAAKAGRSNMGRAGSLKVKVVRTPTGARLTMSGKNASRYKDLVTTSIKESMPATLEAIKASIIASAR